jgi:putative nucleotidyltransferase with HDIG domain
MFNDFSYNILYTTDSKNVIDLIKNNNIDVVLTDQMMSPNTGIDILKYCNKNYCNAIKILMTGCSDLSVAIKSINEGNVYYYIRKPWNDEEIKKTVHKAMDLKRKNDEDEKIVAEFYKVKSDYQRLLNEMGNKIEEYRREIIASLLKIIKSKDTNLYKHSTNVAKYASNIAFLCNKDYNNYYNLVIAALLHDIGKIAIRDHILYKPSKLDNDEFKNIKNHVIAGFKIVNDFDFLEESANMILQHHERIDGSGYPNGIKGEAITFEGKVIGLCDSFDALTSERPYKEKYDIHEALRILCKDKDLLFDSDIVDILLENYNFIIKNDNFINYMNLK